MPKEKINIRGDREMQPYHVELGWGQGGVQLGVVTRPGNPSTSPTGNVSIIQELYRGNPDNKLWDEIGQALLRNLVNSRPNGERKTKLKFALDAEFWDGKDVGEFALMAFDEVRPFDSLWTDLDRTAINQMIRVLRRARDASFGKDE